MPSLLITAHYRYTATCSNCRSRWIPSFSVKAEVERIGKLARGWDHVVYAIRDPTLQDHHGHPDDPPIYVGQIKQLCPWRWMPNDLPPWAAVYQQAQRWLAAGRQTRPTAAIIDSRTLRSKPASRERAAKAAARHGIALEIVKLPEVKRGFVFLPRRWVVERSFAWVARFRLVSDYERYAETLAGLHVVVFDRNIKTFMTAIALAVTVIRRLRARALKEPEFGRIQRLSNR